jgi:biopolymer transport protein ExbD
MPHLSAPERKINKTIVISIDSSMNFFWGTEKISWDSLQARLTPTYDTTNEFSRVVIRPDGTVPFREVYKVMRLAKTRGYQTVMSMKED